MPAPGGPGLVTDLSVAWIAGLLDGALKGTILLLLAGLAGRLLARSSAASRHLVWAAALVGLLALPALAPLAPTLEVPFLPRIGLVESPSAPPAEPVEEGPRGAAAPSPRPVSPSGASAAGPPPPPAVAGQEPEAVTPAAGGPGWLARTDPRVLPAVLWILGALPVLATLLVGKVRIRWLARDAEVVRDGPWADVQRRIADDLGLDREVLLLRVSRPLVPMTWGVLRPRVMLPATADAWSDACLRNVLLHELAHVKRRDCLVRSLGRLACAVYWFHPLVWHAVRRLRLEQEEACDDHVLRTGTLASDYADQLLDVARLLRAVRTPAHAGSAGGGRSDFMRRIRALLDGGRSRRPVRRRTAAALGSAAGAVVLALAAARPAGPPDGPGLDGGAPLPATAGGPGAVRPDAAESPAVEVAAVRVSPPGEEPDAEIDAPADGPPESRHPDVGPDGAASADRPVSDGRPAPRRAHDADPAAAGVDGEAVGEDGGDGAAAVLAGDETAGEAARPRGGASGAGPRSRGEERGVAPLEAALVSYWHGPARFGAPEEASPEQVTREPPPPGEPLAPVTASAEELARKLDDLEDAAAREGLLRRSVDPGSISSLAVMMELSIRATRPTDRRAAVRILAAKSSPARARSLYQVARSNPWADVRAAAVGQLRRMEPERVVPWLVTLAYEDADPAVQRRVVTELASLDREGVDTSLVQIARSHPEARVRLEAIVWLLRTGSGRALSTYVENA